MAFRADEAAQSGYEKIKNYLIPRHLSSAELSRSESLLAQIVDKCGPAVEGYPTWHPLVRQHDGRHPEMYPNKGCGYEGLDHTKYLAHGFVTCPYGDGQSVLDSVKKLQAHSVADITAERLDVSFYNENATPILVRCNWSRPLEQSSLIPKRLAVPLMLEQELPCWEWAERAEPWEKMRPYLLGEPHEAGRHSSSAKILRFR